MKKVILLAIALFLIAGAGQASIFEAKTLEAALQEAHVINKYVLIDFYSYT